MVPSEPRVRGPAAPTVGPAVQEADEGLDRARRDLGVRVQEEDVRRPGRAPALVAGAGEADVLRVGDDEGLRVTRAHGVGGPVRAGVVDDDELEREGRVGAQGVEAGEERLARLEGHDHDRQPGRVAHRPAASSRSARVRVAVSAHEWRAASARPASTRLARRALVREHAVEGRRDRGLVAGVHEERRVAEDLAQRGRAADDEGHAAGGGLEGGQAEALVLGEEDRGVGGGVAIGERRPPRRSRRGGRGPAGRASGPSPEGRSAGACGSRRRRPGRGRGGGSRGGRRRAAAPARSGD